MWLASGFYRVLPDEVGVVLRFGAYNRTTQPGLNYHLPDPIESVLTPSVTRVNRTEIGYRSGETGTGREVAARQVPEEALMLTGDENIVDINFTVFWVIKDAKAYLFNIRDPELTVKSAAESAMREVIGETLIAQALAEGRGQDRDRHPEAAAVDPRHLRRRDRDHPVAAAAGRSARPRSSTPSATCRRHSPTAPGCATRPRPIATASCPRARGDAVQIEQEAEAYRLAIVARSQGDAARFLSVYHAFKVAQDVTLERLYLETMEEVLKNSNKVIIDKSAEGGQAACCPICRCPRSAPAVPRRPREAPPRRNPARRRRCFRSRRCRPHRQPVGSNDTAPAMRPGR